MSVWAFDTACSIGDVSAVPMMGWFEDTSVPSAPSPITDCDILDFLPLPDQAVCPDLAQTIVARSTAVQQGYERLALTISQGADCAFVFQLDAAFPVACPTFPSTVTQAVINTVGPRQGNLGIQLVLSDPVTTSYSDSDGSSVSTAPPGCAFDLIANIDFPCVAFKINPTVVRYAQNQIAAARFSFSEGDGSYCSYVLSPEIDFPCAILPKATTPVVRYVPQGEETLDFYFHQIDGSTCSYSMDTSIDMPQPGLFGQVVSGIGAWWTASVYPQGPGSTPHTASISIPGSDPYALAPAGSWIAPIQQIANPTTTGSPLYFAPPVYLELEWAILTSIAANVSGTLGSATAQLLQCTGTQLQPFSPVQNVTVLNAWSLPVSSETLALIGKVNGYRFVLGTNCVPMSAPNPYPLWT